MCVCVCVNVYVYFNVKYPEREFLGNLVVRNWHFYYQGLSLTPGWRTKILHATCAKSLQSRLTLRNPMDGSPPGSSVHGISQGSILECVAISFSRGSSLHMPRGVVNK